MIRPRDPDIHETNRPTATEADLNNRLLQTTSSKELLAITRKIRERQVANSEGPNKSRRHLPSVPKPCGIGYQTRPPLMKRFEALIGDWRIAWSHQRKRDSSGHVAKICTSASTQRNDEARTSTFLAGTPVVSVWQGFLWRFVEKLPASASTQSQHPRTQQRSERRGCHSHPTYGEMEIDTEGCACTNRHDDVGVRRFQRIHERPPHHVGQVGRGQL